MSLAIQAQHRRIYAGESKPMPNQNAGPDHYRVFAGENGTALRLSHTWPHFRTQTRVRAPHPRRRALWQCLVRVPKLIPRACLAPQAHGPTGYELVRFLVASPNSGAELLPPPAGVLTSCKRLLIPLKALRHWGIIKPPACILALRLRSRSAVLTPHPQKDVAPDLWAEP